MLDNDQPKGRELSPGFLRQRRNLLLISIIMPLFFLSNASIEKISLLGTQISVDNPVVLKVGVLVLAIYFLWRYYQYRGEENHSHEFNHECRKQVFEREFEYFSGRLIEKAKCFDYEYIHPFFSKSVGDFRLDEYELPKLSNDKKISWLKRSRVMEANGFDSKYENINAEDGELTESERELILKTWVPVPKSSGNSHAEPIFSTKIDYLLLTVIWLRLTGVIIFLFKRPHFTDYQLPLWLGILSIVISTPYLFPIFMGT